MNPRLRYLAIGLTLIFSSLLPIAPAHAALQTLNLYGANGTTGDRDPYTDFSSDGGITWQGAYIAAGSSGGSHPWGNITGTDHWLNCVANMEQNPSPCLNNTIRYRVRFYAPDTFTAPTMSIKMNVDNYGSAYLNNLTIFTSLAGTSPGNSQTTYTPDITSALKPGLNYLYLDAIDVGGWAGFNYVATFTVQASSGFVQVAAGAAVAATAPKVVASGSYTKMAKSTISATSVDSGTVSFYQGKALISGCKDRPTTGTSPNFSATCLWRPIIQGNVSLTAKLQPYDQSLAVVASSTNVTVRKRSGAR